MTWLVMAPVAWIALAILVVSGVAFLSARRRSWKARTRLRELNSLRSPSGRPFFPNTPEEKRREARVLRGWDPDWDD